MLVHLLFKITVLNKSFFSLSKTPVKIHNSLTKVNKQIKHEEQTMSLPAFNFHKYNALTSTVKRIKKLTLHIPDPFISATSTC